VISGSFGVQELINMGDSSASTMKNEDTYMTNINQPLYGDINGEII